MADSMDSKVWTVHAKEQWDENKNRIMKPDL